MSPVVISVSNLGKCCRIAHQAERHRYTALRDVLAQKAKGIVSKLKFRKQKTENGNRGIADTSQFPLFTFPISTLASSEDFWAFRDISFEVKRGEVVGIIGLPWPRIWNRKFCWWTNCWRWKSAEIDGRRIFGEITTMRLGADEVQTIREEIRQSDPAAEIYLYGSRADDSAKGGDIDLLVVSGTLGFRDVLQLRTRILDRIGWQQLDLLVRRRDELDEPLAALAQATGIKL